MRSVEAFEIWRVGCQEGESDDGMVESGRRVNS